jgi:hypothetical protein
MSNEKINPKDNSSNQQNANKGTSGTNPAYDKNQGNRGAQLDPKQNQNNNNNNKKK